MKSKFIFLTALFAAVLTSCVTTSFYQVYKAVPSEKITPKESNLVYEDENCIVYYNLWGEGGNIGFRFYNKTDKNIYLNMEESFFILNGMAFNYYLNRVFTNSTNTGTTIPNSKPLKPNNARVVNTSGYSVSRNEEKIVCIPSKASKAISEYSINQNIYRDCDLFRFPLRSQITTKNFTKSNSPFVFSNKIEYKLGLTGNPVKFENEFYVTEITNYPEPEIMERRPEEYCGQKIMNMELFFKNSSPDKFYIKYMKLPQEFWRH